jgi:hypothetical protein
LPPEPEVVEDVELPDFESFHRVDHIVDRVFDDGVEHGVDHVADHLVDHNNHDVDHGVDHGVDHDVDHIVDHGVNHGVGHGVDHDVDHDVEPLPLFLPQVELSVNQDSLDFHPIPLQPIPRLNFQVEQTSHNVVASNHHQQSSESSDNSNFQRIPQRVAQPNPQPVSKGFDQAEFQAQKARQQVVQSKPAQISQVQNVPKRIAQSNSPPFDQSAFQVPATPQRINNLPDPRLPRQRANQGKKVD